MIKYLLIMYVVIMSGCFQETLENLYFEQTPPGRKPVVFAPGIVSLADRYEYNITFSPDGKEYCVGVTNSNWSWSTLWYSKQINGNWSEPDTAYFQGGFDGWIPSFSPDGQRLYFNSARPNYPPADIRMCTRTDSAWSAPVKLKEPINSSSDEWRLTEANSNTLYFVSSRSGGEGGADIYRARLSDGKYSTVENLGSSINSKYLDSSPFIAPDESYLIFESHRPGGYGQGDLYISFRTQNDTWTESVNLGSLINTDEIEDGGYVSSDGKYFFFNRRKSWQIDKATDIYWVNAHFIDSIKQTIVFKPYLGQKPPGIKPEVFAPDNVSLKGRFERVAAFSPNGKELFFNVVTPDWSSAQIYHTKAVNGKWTEPKIASFSKIANNAEPFFSPDGQRLYFTSNRPPGSGWNYDFWMVEKTDTSWSEPKRLSPAINSNTGEWHPCIVRDGTLYFARDGEILISRFVDGKYQQAQNIGKVINSTSQDWDPYVDPDETYMIFKSDRPGGYGDMDLYISFKNADGLWLPPQNMGPNLNTKHHDDAGDISPDGKFLFFARKFGSSDMDVYWVESKVIEQFRSDLTRK